MRAVPEFQVLANHFNPLLAGDILLQIQVLKPTKIREKQYEFDKNLKDQVLKSVYRHGKELHFKFINNVVLGMNLMLHGNIQLFERINDHKFTIAELHFKSGKGLALTDWQGSAVIRLNPDEEDGIDPLAKNLLNYLLSSLQSRAKIKTLITNEKILRGIGHVYADEILWEAKISPFSVSHSVPEFKIKALANAIRKVLINAEKHLMSKGLVLLSGERHDFLKIFGKEGEASPSGSIIKVTKKAGHTTYFTDEQILYK